MRPLFAVAACLAVTSSCAADTKTWDGKYDTSRIEVTVVYFVPSDRRPLTDWRDRVDYFCRRIEQFHAREFQGQSRLTTTVHSEPLISESSTSQLRVGDANAIYYRTLQETDRRLTFAVEKSDAFSILLVLSDINWRPLDDFYRLRPADNTFEFEGNYRQGAHFPGATSGGARAAYLADRGIGWGLVSADGWRVPYRGSDCVVYHEGCGHTVGLPHPEPGNGSVMSLAQYNGWISESWLDKEQKLRLGWQPDKPSADPQMELFMSFRALPVPTQPAPGQEVRLDLDWPENVNVKALRVRFQTSLFGPWIEVPQNVAGGCPPTAAMGTFDRETPVSYRVDAELQDGSTAELWGYFQVRSNPALPPQPWALSPDLTAAAASEGLSDVIAEWPTGEQDLLNTIDPATAWMVGEWTMSDGQLLSPKRYGARLELPHTPPEEYCLTLIVEPLDEPNGLILGQRSGEHRFVALFSYLIGDEHLSAVENIDGRNVGNETTFKGKLFQQNRLSLVSVTVRKTGVRMAVDGRTIIHWKEQPDRLSLSDYWQTPNKSALFIGAYDCRYRIHRISLETISETGAVLSDQ